MISPDPSSEQRFRTRVDPGHRGAIQLPVPFDPDEVWGSRPRHLVSGTVDGCAWRGEIELVDSARVLRIGPAWHRDHALTTGSEVEVMISPEGPQRATLDPDLEAALAADPAAAAFFDGLAQFYRKAYLTWIAGTSRRPDERRRRIAETVRLLAAGIKQRPK